MATFEALNFELDLGEEPAKQQESHISPASQSPSFEDQNTTIAENTKQQIVSSRTEVSPDKQVLRHIQDPSLQVTNLEQCPISRDFKDIPDISSVRQEPYENPYIPVPVQNLEQTQATREEQFGAGDEALVIDYASTTIDTGVDSIQSYSHLDSHADHIHGNVHDEHDKSIPHNLLLQSHIPCLDQNAAEEGGVENDEIDDLQTTSVPEAHANCVVDKEDSISFRNFDQLDEQYAIHVTYQDVEMMLFRPSTQSGDETQMFLLDDKDIMFSNIQDLLANCRTALGQSLGADEHLEMVVGDLDLRFHEGSVSIATELSLAQILHIQAVLWGNDGKTGVVPLNLLLYNRTKTEARLIQLRGFMQNGKGISHLQAIDALSDHCSDGDDDNEHTGSSHLKDHFDTDRSRHQTQYQGDKYEAPNKLYDQLPSKEQNLHMIMTPASTFAHQSDVDNVGPDITGSTSTVSPRSPSLEALDTYVAQSHHVELGVINISPDRQSEFFGEDIDQIQVEDSNYDVDNETPIYIKRHDGSPAKTEEHAQREDETDVASTDERNELMYEDSARQIMSQTDTVDLDTQKTSVQRRMDLSSNAEVRGDKSGVLGITQPESTTSAVEAAGLISPSVDFKSTMKAEDHSGGKDVLYNDGSVDLAVSSPNGGRVELDGASMGSNHADPSDLTMSVANEEPDAIDLAGKAAMNPDDDGRDELIADTYEIKEDQSSHPADQSEEVFNDTPEVGGQIKCPSSKRHATSVGSSDMDHSPGRVKRPRLP